MPSLIARVHNKLDTLLPLNKRNKHISFAIVLIGASLDNINVAGSLATFTSIQKHFDADSPTATWVLSAYALTLGAFIMLGGKMTDILGPKRVFLSGLGLSSLMCLICAAIENQIIVLIVFRALQGMFAAVTIPSMFPIAYSYYASAGMGPAILAIMVVLTSSNGVGLVVGGAFALTDQGYKGFYYFSFALAFSVVCALYLTMYPVETHSENKDVFMKNLDLPGTAMIVVGILLIILGLTEGGESWKKPAAYVPIPVGVLVLAFGGWFELGYIQGYKDKVDRKRAETLPEKKTDCTETTSQIKKDWRYDLMILIPRQAFTIINFIPFITSITLCYIVYLGLLTTNIQYSQVIEGDSALMAGLKALPLTVGLTSGAVINNEKLIYRIHMKWVITASQAANVLLLVWVSYGNHHVKHNYWKFTFVPLLLFGFFVNTYFGVYYNAVLRNTPGHLQGAVSGLLQTLAQVGICLGNALMATLQGVMSSSPTEEQKEVYTRRFKRSYYVLIGIAVAQVLIMLLLKNQKTVENAVPEKDEAQEATSEETSTTNQV